MKVADLSDYVSSKDTSLFQRTSLDKLEYANRMLRGEGPEGEDFEFRLDDAALGTFGSYFKIPVKYLPRLPDALANETLNYFMSDKDDPLILQHDGWELTEIYSGATALLPRNDVIEMIADVIGPDAPVANVVGDNGAMRVDVLTEVGTEPRPGDVTKGGVQFYAHISPAEKSPTVSTFLERLICGNGMTATETDGIISIKGSTVPEIIAEMELAAIRVMDGLDIRLQQWANLTQINVDNAERMIHRLCQENGISAIIESRIIDRIPELEGYTLYDVINLMTSMHGEDGVNDKQLIALQSMAGQAIVTQGAHRCPACAHALGH